MKRNTVYRGQAKGFYGCVAPRHCNPLAHGGVTFHEVRTFRGAYQRRAVNSTGFGREEYGPWQPCDAATAASESDTALAGE